MLAQGDCQAAIGKKGTDLENAVVQALQQPGGNSLMTFELTKRAAMILWPRVSPDKRGRHIS